MVLATVGRSLSVPRGAVPLFARRTVLAIAAVVALAHLAASSVGGYWFDEVYMLAIGRHHLDWGSADQPPVTPLLAAVMDQVAPGSIVALRLPAVLATAAAVVVAALIAREFGGDRCAQTITAAAQGSTLWITLAGHWLTPYTLEPVQWLTLCWLLVRWLRRREDRLLLAVGAVAGLAAETKFQVLLLAAVLLLAVAAFGPRALLRAPMLWAGAGIGALLALPTLIWQAVNGWPQLKMGAVVTAEAEYLYGGRPGVAIELVVLAGVAGTVLALYGLALLLRTPEYRFLGVTTLVLFGFLVAAPGRPYYLGGLYGLLAAAGAVGLQRRREAGMIRWRRLLWPGYALSVAAAAALLVVSTSIVDSGVGEGIARRAAAAYQALPAQQRDRTAVMGESYIVAAYLDGYSTTYGLPPAYSNNRSYGYFPPPPESQDAVLYVGSAPDALRPYFAEVHQVADGGPDASVWLCTGRREPWSTLWPQLRTLTVG